MTNNTKLENILKEIVKHNYKQLNKVDYDQSQAKNLYIIEHDGMSIYDFFSDETMREEVNPLEYYPQEKLLTLISRYNSTKRV